MSEIRIPRRDVELLALHALAGGRVPLLLRRRRYTLTVDPIFRIEDGGDGFLYFCCGIESLQQRLEDLNGSREERSSERLSELGGARGPH